MYLLLGNVPAMLAASSQQRINEATNIVLKEYNTWIHVYIGLYLTVASVVSCNRNVGS
jgi:hypothetical protein